VISLWIIRQPSEGTLEMLKNRMWRGAREKLEQIEFDTIGLVEGHAIEMLAAADIAEKAAPVRVIEILGLCPQHFTMVGVLGQSDGVLTALEAIKRELGAEWLAAGRERVFTALRRS